MPILIEAAARVNMGTQRDNNEDNIYFNGAYLSEETRERPVAWEAAYSNWPQLYAVCDGMGGEQLGELASLLAVQTLHQTALKLWNMRTSELEPVLDSCVTEANLRVYYEQKNRNVRNIGTTLAMLAVSENQAHVYNVGDSRVYLLRDGKLIQLSEDHTTVMRSVKMGLMTPDAARTHPHRNRLTQFIGINPDEMIIEPHKVTFLLNNRDIFLMCSDGLTDVVNDAEIAGILRSAYRSDEATQNLVNIALAHHTPDNVAVIVLRIQI